MMLSWRDQYLQALKAQNLRTEIQTELIDAYSQLADKVAVLEAEKAAIRGPITVSTSVESADQLKADLAEALRARSQLHARYKIVEKELGQLKAKSVSDTQTIKNLSQERTILATKVKDRDEELRGKTKLVEDVQDEMLSLNLQLNMAEQRSKKLLTENRELIDRWMARKGEEADAINNASKFS